MAEPCVHFEQVRVTEASTDVCQDCLDVGSRWVHLRMCLVCGNVGCCDSSPNKHASRHYSQTHDPVIRSAEPGESWAYCFVDDLFLEEVPGP